jgi:hypothetical protein
MNFITTLPAEEAAGGVVEAALQTANSKQQSYY